MILLPNRDNNQAGARLKPGAVLEAIEYFELKWPIEIRWSRTRKVNGYHRAQRRAIDPRQFTDKHLVILTTHNDAEATSQTLWHELAHAAQAERAGSMTIFKAESHTERTRVGYWDSGFEIEARAAESFHDELPLAE